MERENKKKASALARLGCIALAAIIVISGAFMDTAPVFADTLGANAIKIEKDGPQRVVQGATEEFGLTVTNNQTQNIAFDTVEITIENNTANQFKTSVNPTGSVTVKPGEKTHIGFKITTRKNVAAKNYQYYVTLKNQSETIYTSQFMVFNVAESSSSSKYAQYFDGAEIYASIEPQDALYVGSNLLTIDVYNASLNILRNCQVTLKLPEGVTIKNGSNTVNVGYIESLSTANCSFEVYVDEEAATGSKEFTIDLKAAARIKEGTDYDGNSNYTDKDYSTSKSFYFYVNAKEKKDDNPGDAEANPRLMVKGYSIGGSSVAAGSTVNLTMDVVNTSKKTLYNVKVSVSGDGAFVPVGTSNSYYIEKISAGTSKSHTMTLKCDNSAEAGAKGLTVSMAYEDSKGTAFSSEDTISIKVTQPCKLVIGQLTLPQEAYVGEETTVQLTYYNMGKNTLSNVMVSVSGNFDQYQNNGDFGGNMASGTDDDYSCYIVPIEEGLVEGIISLQYDDTEGNTVVEEVPFSFEATEFVPDDMGEWEEPEPEKPGIPWKAIIILAVIVLLAAGAIIFRKIRKKRLEKKLAIEDAAYEIEDKEEKKEDKK